MVRRVALYDGNPNPEYPKLLRTPCPPRRIVDFRRAGRLQGFDRFDLLGDLRGVVVGAEGQFEASRLVRLQFFDAAAFFLEAPSVREVDPRLEADHVTVRARRGIFPETEIRQLPD